MKHEESENQKQFFSQNTGTEILPIVFSSNAKKNNKIKPNCTAHSFQESNFTSNFEQQVVT